ncbi:MAG: inositol-3-phosphate synthase [Pirellulaceae bacterium]
MARKRVGIWLLGAKGGVATTAIVGLSALKQGLTGDQGLVTQLPLFAGVDLSCWDEFVVGGHEVRDTTLYDEAVKLRDVSRVLDHHLIEQVKGELDAIEANIRPGVMFNVGHTIEELAAPTISNSSETPRESIRRVQQDLDKFVKQHELERVIMLNVASTEPAINASQIPAAWADLDELLDDASACPLAASSLYAIAALDQGHAYINFTPSLGSAPPAICELALQRGACHMGHDGKTGETLLKSALAPMFANRNLEIMSWVGHNIFGNMDGKVLNDPINKQTKVTSKDRLLAEILGYHPQTHVSIEYIESLGDWKTAWDHIHFKGFLGTPMVMQFTWQGCDSLLAAPLVLDLIRLTECAQRRGEKGLLTFLASFFKSPLGVRQNDFVRQFQMLEQWVSEQSPSSA